MERSLTPWGRQAVARMNQLGMMVDIPTFPTILFTTALAVTKAPADWLPHSSVPRRLCKAPRNLTDDMIRALAKNGGVMDVNTIFRISQPSLPRTGFAKIEKSRSIRRFPRPRAALRQSGQAAFPILRKFALSAASTKDLPAPSYNRHCRPHLTTPSKWGGIDHVGAWVPTLTALIRRRGGMEDVSKISCPGPLNLPKRGYKRGRFGKNSGRQCWLAASCARWSRWRVSSKSPNKNGGCMRKQTFLNFGWRQRLFWAQTGRHGLGRSPGHFRQRRRPPVSTAHTATTAHPTTAARSSASLLNPASLKLQAPRRLSMPNSPPAKGFLWFEVNTRMSPRGADHFLQSGGSTISSMARPSSACCRDLWWQFGISPRARRWPASGSRQRFRMTPSRKATRAEH